MKCNEPMPGKHYEECQLALGHSGNHEYFGTRWARPVPMELDADVDEMTQAAARVQGREWDLDERDYYIAFEVTNVYLVKVTAESEDEALGQFDDGDWPDFNREQAIDGGVEVRRPTQWERRDLVPESLGPRIACPGCGRLASKREWFHDPLRKCHGPIQWYRGYNGRAHRERVATPVYAPKAVAS